MFSKLREIEIKGWKTNTTKTQTKTKADKDKGRQRQKEVESRGEGFLLRVWWIIHRREVEGRHLVQLPQWHRWSNQIWKLTAYSTIPAKSGKPPWKKSAILQQKESSFEWGSQFVKIERGFLRKFLKFLKKQRAKGRSVPAQSWWCSSDELQNFWRNPPSPGRGCDLMK